MSKPSIAELARVCAKIAPRSGGLVKYNALLDHANRAMGYNRFELHCVFADSLTIPRGMDEITESQFQRLFALAYWACVGYLGVTSQDFYLWSEGVL